MVRRVVLVRAIGIVYALVAGALPANALQGPYSAVVTRISVRLTERLSSQEARVGDTFGFDTTSSVAIDGLFLAAGTHGRGVVVAARAARGPHPGELRLAARSLDLPTGRTLAVGLEAGQLHRTLDERGVGVSVPVGGTTIAFGSERTTNVVFERGTPFVVVAPPPEPEPAASATAG